MKFKKVLSKLICAAMILTLSVSAVACSSDSSSNSTVSSSSHVVSKIPQEKVPDDGYELPYEYSDGYKAKLNTIEDTTYMTFSTDSLGNKNIHFKTEKSEEEVKKYYDDYFSKLQEVKAKEEINDTKAYYDKDKKLIMYNLIIWTADGKTNYRIGCEACENLADNKNWEAK